MYVAVWALYTIEYQRKNYKNEKKKKKKKKKIWL